MTSTPASRAAARDRWNSPGAAALGRAVEWITALAVMAAIFILGSLNY